MFVLFRRARFFYNKLELKRLRYALPFLVLVLYTVAGAYVFRYFELEWDEDRRIRYRQSTEYAFKRTLNRMLEVQCQEGMATEDRTLQARHVKEHLFWLMDYLNLTQVIEERSDHSPWTWMGAMFYAGQLYTTIGYGLPATQTPAGRIASIVYIMIGIPLFLLILAEVGKLLSHGLRKLYRRVHKMKRLPEAARRMSEPMKAIYQITYALASTAIGSTAAPMINGDAGGNNPNNSPSLVAQAATEAAQRVEAERQESKRQQEKAAAKASGEHSSKSAFPIPWALAILIVWILFSAALFCVWETEWGYMTSIYFFFVSISTVGLGDLVPTKPDMMIVNFFMILIGLALLSMCVNLIQGALEKLIEGLIDQYINEIEKIAAVVTNPEAIEYTEDLKPFEVEMTEMLTVPATTLGGGEKLQSVGQSMKDWFAEKASNMLLNKIYPEQSDSSSSESEEEEEDQEELEALELEEVVVIDREPVMVHGAAKVTVHRPSLAEQIEKRRAVEAANQQMLLPQIAIHEGTPPPPALLAQAKRQQQQQRVLQMADGRKVSVNQSVASTPGREGSAKRKKQKKPPKVPKNYAGALLKYSAPTMQAIQAIEYAKMRTNRNNDFKSRLFAKFATNQRFAQIVENNAPPPKHMVSSSIQTSPVQSPLMAARRKSWRLRKMGCAVESMDSTSSELNVTTTRTNASCSANDLDSLYSNTYFDLCFGNYDSDSVPCLMAQPNTPLQQRPGGRAGEEQQPSLVVRRKFSEKLLGLFGRIIPGSRQGSGADQQGTSTADGDDNGGHMLMMSTQETFEDDEADETDGNHSKRKQRRPLSQCHSSPSTPATNRRRLQYLQEDSDKPSIPTTPLIRMTDELTAAELRVSLTPSPSLATALLDPIHQLQLLQLQQNHRQKALLNNNDALSPPAAAPSPMLGHVPLHHRSMSARRRFSASTGHLRLPGAARSNSLTTLERRRKRQLPADAAARPQEQQQMSQQNPVGVVDNVGADKVLLINQQRRRMSSSNSSAAAQLPPLSPPSIASPPPPPPPSIVVPSSSASSADATADANGIINDNDTNGHE